MAYLRFSYHGKKVNKKGQPRRHINVDAGPGQPTPKAREYALKKAQVNQAARLARIEQMGKTRRTAVIAREASDAVKATHENRNNNNEVWAALGGLVNASMNNGDQTESTGTGSNGNHSSSSSLSTF